MGVQDEKFKCGRREVLGRNFMCSRCEVLGGKFLCSRCEVLPGKFMCGRCEVLGEKFMCAGVKFWEGSSCLIIIINPCKPYLTASAPRLTHWGGGK
jgi:hypothetical protein